MWIETKLAIYSLFCKFGTDGVFTVEDVNGMGYDSRLLGNMRRSKLTEKIGNRPIRINGRYVWEYKFTKSGVINVMLWDIKKLENVEKSCM